MSIEALTAASTFLLALVTAYLAYKTKILADEGRTAQSQAELQHRQQLMPLLRAVESLEAVKKVHVDDSTERLTFTGQIGNRGSGPAFNCRVLVRSPKLKESRFLWKGQFLEAPIPPLGVDDFVTASDYNLSLEQLPVGSGDDRIFAIEYEDVFGQTFRTEYASTGDVTFIPPEAYRASKRASPDRP